MDELSRQGTRETTQISGTKPMNLRSTMMMMINMVKNRNYRNNRDKTCNLDATIGQNIESATMTIVLELYKNLNAILGILTFEWFYGQTLTSKYH